MAFMIGQFWFIVQDKEFFPANSESPVICLYLTAHCILFVSCGKYSNLCCWTFCIQFIMFSINCSDNVTNILFIHSLDGGSARRKAATYTQDNTNTE
jgi:hypothetical protein